MKLPPSATALRPPRGFTIIELMLVVTIVAILASISFVGYGQYIEKANSVDAMNKLKGMYGALNAYIIDKQTWPQEPGDDDADVSDDDLWEWWKEEMKPFGLSDRDWYTEAHLHRLNRQFKESGGKSITINQMGKDAELKFPSILPGKFDPGPTEPYRYEGQPWAGETGEYHGDAGVYTIMPGGAIHQMPSISQMNRAKGKLAGGKP
jgi:prepilin-type N-terminal cleavage/methylation domain-containing protein